MTRWMTTAVIGWVTLLWSGTAFAADYILVLRDGKRLEVRAAYRIVNDVAIFTTSDGKRVSISLANIDIAATERVNGQGDGDFRAKAGPPRVIGADNQVASLDAVAPSPSSPPAGAPPTRKPTRTLTNADFGGGMRDVAASRSRSASSSSSNVMENRGESVPAMTRANDETYWRGRVQAIFTEIYTQQEIIRSLNEQARTLQRKIDRQGTTYLFGRDVFGNQIMLPQEVVTAEKQELMQVNERIRDAQARLTGLYVQYAVLQEEARRLGVPPGWLR